jgi:hypothetical protein
MLACLSWSARSTGNVIAAEALQQTSSIPVRIELKLLSGVTSEVELESIQDGVIRVGARVASNLVANDFPVSETATIVLAKSGSSLTTASVDVLKLTDGTTIQCQKLSGKDNTWSVESESGMSLTAKSSMMGSLQFRNLNKAVREAVNQSSDTPTLTDEMLIVRPGDRVDRISGVILGLDENAVSFSFDGQTIPAPRAKLAGLVWAQPEELTYKPTIRIRTIDGSKWEAIDLTFAKSSENLPLFRWKLRSGIECVCKPDQVASIDFSNAIVRWFAAIPILEAKAFDNPFLSVPVAGRSSLLAPHFKSQGAEAADEPSNKNLLFPVDGEIVARVPDGTTRFRSRIARPDDAKIQDKVLCEVWSNEELLWSNADTSGAAPWVVDVPVIAEKRLRLVVRSQSRLSAGSMVTWVQPRFSP